MPRPLAVSAARPIGRGLLARSAAFFLGAALLVTACSDGPGAPVAVADPSADPLTSPSPTRDPGLTPDPESLCQRVGELELAVARLRGVELKLVNRTALDIEYDNVEMSFDVLAASDLGPFEDELEEPLQRLSYRLGELELAVEDFRTNSRPRRAAPHVEGDASTFADDVTAFRVLARC